MGDTSVIAQKPRRFKWLIRFGIALAVYTIVGFFVVPAIIKSQLVKRLPALTKRQAAIEQVQFNPYALSLTIRGFSLKEPSGEVFSSFDEFYGNFQLWASLFKRSWVFAEISLKKPYAQVIYKADGSFNFANLIDKTIPAKPAPPGPPQPLPSLVIYDLSITNGAFSFSDLKRKNPFHTEFIPINVRLTDLTTIRNDNSPYSFVARTASGESFAWRGTVTLNPLRSSGTFRLGGFKLGKYATYSHDYAKFEIVNGALDVATDYAYDASTNSLNASITNAVVNLTQLELKAPDTGEMVISIPTLMITNVSANLAEQTARVGLIKSSNGSFLIRQNNDGTLNLLSLLDLPVKTSTEVSPPAPATNAAPFVARIDEIAFDNYAFKIEDKKPAKPASFTIDQFNLDLKNISNLSNAPVTAAVSLRFQQTGKIAVKATAALMPVAAEVELALTNVDLRSIQPYVQEQVRLAIRSGALDLNGKAHFALTNGRPKLDFNGGVSVKTFATADEVLFKDFIKWEALDISGIHFTLSPQQLHVGQVKFTGLQTSLIIGPDHRANLQTVLRDQLGSTNASALATNANSNGAATAFLTAPTAPATNAVVKPPLPDIALTELALENASLHFEDQSVEPHCAFDIQKFGGTIRGLSSQTNSMATLDLHGNVDSHSPFSISGKVQPLGGDLFADITVAFTNTELTAFTPYTEKFAGRPLQKGKLSFAVHYLIDKKTLKAENGFYVDQFTLGAKNDNTNATKLPVKLAIALLKDRKGRIQIEAPLSGRTDDPKFKILPLLWQVVGNLMVKAAASPFSLLGSMFGAGPELSFVNFTPGQSAIPDAETNKLEILGKALFERPELSLEINGTVDPEQDRAPLARAKLEQKIKTLWIKQQTAKGKSAISLEEVRLKPEEYARLLKELFKAEIGANASAQTNSGNASVAVVTNEPAAATNQPATKMLSVLLGQNDDDQRGAARLFLNQPKKSSATPYPKTASPVAASTKKVDKKAAQQADMETQLLEKITVSDDDLRDLMKQRAASVQAYLLKTGKITADRLFITAPKPLSALVKGEDRVNLTLD